MSHHIVLWCPKCKKKETWTRRETKRRTAPYCCGCYVQMEVKDSDFPHIKFARDYSDEPDHA